MVSASGTLRSRASGTPETSDPVGAVAGLIASPSLRWTACPLGTRPGIVRARGHVLGLEHQGHPERHLRLERSTRREVCRAQRRIAIRRCGLGVDGARECREGRIARGRGARDGRRRRRVRSPECPLQGHLRTPDPQHEQGQRDDGVGPCAIPFHHPASQCNFFGMHSPLSSASDARPTLLVTGGAGFIGSALVRQLIAETDVNVLNVDVLTYAGNLESLGAARHDPRHVHVRQDIADAAAMRALFAAHRPSAVLHLAAESHVDRSIDGPAGFVQTNVVGTFTLLQTALEYWSQLDAAAAARFRFVQVSTDEVYGSLGPEGAFSEDTRYDPSSPYSATKAAADHLARAWHRTYGLPVLVTNCSNNFGPYQFPEKLIPTVITRALAAAPIPVYGDGANVRDWLYVDDHARALRLVLARGEPGRTYNIGGGCEQQNIAVVRRICALLDARRPDPAGSHERLITFVRDRPGHDRRYAIDDRRIRNELGWDGETDFDTALAATVDWYLANEAWVQRVVSGEYQREALWLEAARPAL